MSEREALRTLLDSKWFFEEMENANYHSAYDFMDELYRTDAKDGNELRREDHQGLDQSL